uniref:C-type lectin domain-containing protein n=1 Tax=Xiphophorus maculatus TaxID=8083 RepID=A0A3B5QR54_XIPMA
VTQFIINGSSLTVVLFTSDGHCDRGYLLYKDSCYHFETEQVKNWQDAEADCVKENLGAELVSIHSMKEQSWVESYLYLATSDVWTGLNDLGLPGMFMWSNEHIVTFTYWAPGEPNNHDGFSEDCVEMLHQTGRWNDVSCTDSLMFSTGQPRVNNTEVNFY